MRARGQGLSHHPAPLRHRTHGTHREAARFIRIAPARWLKAEPIACNHWGADVDQQLAALRAHHHTEFKAVIVRLGAGDIVATRSPAIHPARETTAEDLHQRFGFGLRRLHELAALYAVEKLAIGARHGRYILGFLFAPFDFETADPSVCQFLQMGPGPKVFGRDQVAAIQLRAAVDVREDVVFAAGLGTGAAVRAALGDHTRHKALSGIRDAERPVHKALESEPRHLGPNRSDIIERIFAREHDALYTELLHHTRTAAVVHGHLRGAVNLKARVRALNEAHQPNILHNRGVDPPINTLAQMKEGVLDFVRLHEDVEREIHPRATLVRDQAGLLKIVEGQLGAFVTRVELLDTEVYGVGAIRDRRTNGVKGSCGGEEFWAGHRPKIVQPSS